MSYDVLVVKNNRQYQYSQRDDRPTAELEARQQFFRGAKEVRVLDNATNQEVYRIGD